MLAWALSNVLSWTKGTHNVKFGFDAQRMYLNHYETQIPVFTFNGGATALSGGASPNNSNQFADFLLGLPFQRNAQAMTPLLDASGWTWGVSGSAGFELATGIEALHERSDLDLILRTPHCLDRLQARELLAQLDASVCAVDMQLQTPCGAVALREWAGSARRCGCC